MNIEEFKQKIAASVPVGTILKNPGSGTSEIVKMDSEKIVYIRKNSKIYVSIADLYSAFQKFSGKRVTTNDLKEFAPDVFDSAARPAGHSCNCTFMFLVLGKSGLAGVIEGEGKKGKPFGCRFY